MKYPKFSNVAAVNAELAEIAEVRYALRVLERQHDLPTNENQADQADLDDRTRELLTQRRALQETLNAHPFELTCGHCGHSHGVFDSCQP